MTEKVSLPERLEATFLKSAPNLSQCPRDDVAEVAFAGRSNAGKSSVLNAITGNKRMAKGSKTPGRTQLLNLFDLNRGGRLVDLPGYGMPRRVNPPRSPGSNPSTIICHDGTTW